MKLLLVEFCVVLGIKSRMSQTEVMCSTTGLHSVSSYFLNLFLFYGFFPAYIPVHHAQALCPWRPESDSLTLVFQTIVSCYMGSEN